MNALWIALSTLTVLPTPASNPTAQDLKRSVAFYPLIGGLFGGLFFLIEKINLAADLKALVLLFTWVLVTGAFHLDGLGDCLDGFFGGKDPQDRRRIMKAPDLGAYGLTGIALVLIAKTVLLIRLMGEGDQTYWLLAIPVAARWALCLSCSLFRSPEGDSGLGSAVIGHSFPILLIGSLTAMAFSIPLHLLSLGLFGIAAAISLGVGLLSQQKIGGLTGDGLGATVELTETALLFFACLNSSRFFL